MTGAKTVYLKDYRQPDYRVSHTDLNFEIHDNETFVTATLDIERNGTHRNPLVLDGVDLELLDIALDGVPLQAGDYKTDAESLTLHAPDADRFTVTTRVRIHPETNTTLNGFYKSGPMFCTQCESRGFRHITYAVDRPDNMSTYSVRLESNAATMPVLLSNGNKTGEGDLGNGRIWTSWHDPFPKPSYLFAIVAGDLHSLDSTYKTMSGRDVSLRIWAEEKDIDKLDHAMQSLKDSMKWDEDRWGREYDLDIFQIVATPYFNFGAMENKSLNIFNSSYVLASRRTQTDDNYESIKAVVGHEYFHNWTGNRITCRDWFQLTLKEGLTVFRDQEFTADASPSRAVVRIDQVADLRRAQFPEDKGPMAHPIRPDRFENIENFYTSTVYEKGAEVIRMIETLIGRDTFRKGMDIYFARHDGQAVTCEDFVACMEDASQRDLTQFKRWYAQAGTPQVEVDWSHDPASGTLRLTFSQAIPPTPGQPVKQPHVIPIRLGLIDAQGDEVVLDPATGATEMVFVLEQETQNLFIQNVPAGAVPSLLRGFSAPITLDAPYTPDHLRHLMLHDTDGFNRYEAGQRFLIEKMRPAVDAAVNGDPVLIDPDVIDVFRSLLTTPEADRALLAQMLTLPDSEMLLSPDEKIDPLAMDVVDRAYREAIGNALTQELQGVYDGNRDDDPAARALKNKVLGYMAHADDMRTAVLINKQYDQANNMTDQQSALYAMHKNPVLMRKPGMMMRADMFYQQFKDDILVVDKWFTAMAADRRSGALARVQALAARPDFDTTRPNRVRALLGGYFSNVPAYHAADGSGYRWLADFIAETDARNPQLASRLVDQMIDFERYAQPYCDNMKNALAQIAVTRGAALSGDLREKLRAAGVIDKDQTPAPKPAP